jgi:hypothetical protein
MRKILGLTILIFAILATPFSILADEQLNETITFAWDAHPQIDRINHFVMSWSDRAGGPYAELVQISKENAIDNQEPIEAVVSGPEETTVTRYFVLAACGDVTKEDGSIVNECSGPSNEVSYDFWIPFSGFSVPVQFRIIPQ